MILHPSDNINSCVLQEQNYKHVTEHTKKKGPNKKKGEERIKRARKTVRTATVETESYDDDGHQRRRHEHKS